MAPRRTGPGPPDGPPATATRGHSCPRAALTRYHRRRSVTHLARLRRAPSPPRASRRRRHEPPAARPGRAPRPPLASVRRARRRYRQRGSRGWCILPMWCGPHSRCGVCPRGHRPAPAARSSRPPGRARPAADRPRCGSDLPCLPAPDRRRHRPGQRQPAAPARRRAGSLWSSRPRGRAGVARGAGRRRRRRLGHRQDDLLHAPGRGLALPHGRDPRHRPGHPRRPALPQAPVGRPGRLGRDRARGPPGRDLPGQGRPRPR